MERRHTLPSHRNLCRVCAQGEHLLHVLNTLGSRKVVLEAELREIEEDIAANANMCRKYGEDFFTEGTARLAQTRAEKAQKLAEIEAQLKDTNSSVQQGKQLLGALAENYGNMAPVSNQTESTASRHVTPYARRLILPTCTRTCFEASLL